MNKLLFDIKSFIRQVNEYYPTYLTAHRHPLNKLAHFLGNIVVVSMVGVVLWAATLHLPVSLLWLFWLPWVSTKLIYWFAWPAHTYIEKNEPATWTVNRWITKACDWKMMFQLLTFQLKWDTRKKDINTFKVLEPKQTVNLKMWDRIKKDDTKQ